MNARRRILAASRRRQGRHARAVVLLEVLLSLTLFAGAAAVVLSGLQASIRSAGDVRLEAQAADLAVTLLSEVQMGQVAAADAGPEKYTDPSLVDWSWQIITSVPDGEDSQTGLKRAEIVISNDRGNYRFRLAHLLPPAEAAPAAEPEPAAPDAPAPAPPAGPGVTP
jgi:type II secretory pathway pseudopilin PulG